MRENGSEYGVFTLPLCWGGGRYAQNKTDLGKEAQIFMETA